MANPLFSALGGAQKQQGGPAGFIQFMQQMRGQDPNQILDQLLSSGKLTQNQLNKAQQMAKQIEGQMSGFKSMFGFN